MKGMSNNYIERALSAFSYIYDCYYYDDCVMSIDNIFIAGKHNIENCMAAIMAVKEFGVNNDVIKEATVEKVLAAVDAKLGKK